MRDYAKGHETGTMCGDHLVACAIREACAEAIADTRRAERRRAAWIVLNYPYKLNMEKHKTELRVFLAKRILGRKAR